MTRPLCDVPACRRPAVSRGLCNGHRQQRDKGRDLTPLRQATGGCAVLTCLEPHHARGLCGKHYQARERNGDFERRRVPPSYFDGLYGRRMLRAIASFTVEGGPDGECWEWVGAYSGKRANVREYPALSMRVGGVRRVLKAHRVAFEAEFGPLPPGEQVHHRCANRRCVRPSHLQAATGRENLAEMLARRSLEARIAALESALRSFQPDHPVLEERLV